MVSKMPDGWVDRFAPQVKRTARQFAKRYWGVVERDDVEQECWLWFLTHVNKVISWDQQHQDDPKAFDRLINRSLANRAHDFCQRERLRQIGAEPSDVFWYDPQLVKMLLPGAIAGDWAAVADTSFGRRSQRDPSERGDWMAYSADIQKAYESLSEADRQLVLKVYVEDGGSAAANGGYASDAVTMAANRAVSKMVRFLGGKKPFWDPEIEVADED